MFSSNLYGSPSAALLPPCNYLPSASISPDFNNIFLKPSIFPDFNLLYPTATTSIATTSSSSPTLSAASYFQLQSITNELIEAERRKLTELEQQLVTHLLQASICQKQEVLPAKSVTSVITKKPHPRPHCCSQCGKRFRFHSNLVEHRTVHFDGSEHYYSCPFCPKKCRLKGNLKKHLHRHFKTQFEVDEAWHQLYGGRSKHPSESSSSSFVIITK